MKKLLVIFVFLMSISLGFAQKIFKSTTELGTKPYVPNAEFQQKVSKLSQLPIIEEGEYREGFSDKNFYVLSNGFISLHEDVKSRYFRMIFDEKQNWVETQVLYHSDVEQDAEYYQIMPKMETQIIAKKYKLEDDHYYYIKITNQKGFWYEVKATLNTKKEESKVFIFDKNLKFVKMQKVAK